MMCPTCLGMGVRADPKVAELVVANLIAGGDQAVEDELDRRRKASGKTGQYWMVDTCPTCNGTGEAPQ